MQTLIQDQARGLMLRMEQSLIMPGMVKMMVRMEGKTAEELEKIGEDEPLTTVIMTLKEFSKGEAQESLFRVPEGFKEVKPEEFTKLYLESMQPQKPGETKNEEKKEDKQ